MADAAANSTPDENQAAAPVKRKIYRKQNVFSLPDDYARIVQLRNRILRKRAIIQKVESGTATAVSMGFYTALFAAVIYFAEGFYRADLDEAIRSGLEGLFVGYFSGAVPGALLGRIRVRNEKLTARRINKKLGDHALIIVKTPAKAKCPVTRERIIEIVDALKKITDDTAYDYLNSITERVDEIMENLIMRRHLQEDGSLPITSRIYRRYSRFNLGAKLEDLNDAIRIIVQLSQNKVCIPRTLSIRMNILLSPWDALRAPFYEAAMAIYRRYIEPIMEKIRKRRQKKADSTD